MGYGTISASSHHISVVHIVEVKSRQDGLELVENLVVLRHVGGQNASAVMREGKPGYHT